MDGDLCLFFFQIAFIFEYVGSIYIQKWLPNSLSYQTMLTPESTESVSLSVLPFWSAY